MKRLAIAIALAAGLLLLSACDTTVTQHARNHLYGADEAIEIIDAESGEALGTLTITGAALLRNEPFQALERGETEEEGERSVTYRQIVQIYYTFTGDRRILSNHFTVNDQTGEQASHIATLDPRPEFEPLPREGQSSFVVALQHESRQVEIEYRFSMWQLRPTAVIELAVPGATAAAPETTIAATTEPPLAEDITETASMQPVPVVPIPQCTYRSFDFLWGALAGAAGVAVIAGLIIILTKNKRKKEPVE